MDKLTSINIEEGKKEDNSVNISTNPSNNCNQNETRESNGVAMNAGLNDTTISATTPDVHRVDKTGPNTESSKTEPTTNTFTNKTQPDNLSNKHVKDTKLCAVDKLSNGKNQGRNMLLVQNEDSIATPSTQRGNQPIINSSSLANILAYGNSSSEDSEPDSVHSLSETYYSDSDEEDEVAKDPHPGDGGSQGAEIANPGNYRQNDPSSSSSDSSDSEESSDDDDVSNLGARSKTTNQSKKVQRTDGEIGIEDLPPVPDLAKLNINVKAEDCIQMGNVCSIVDKLVTIQSLPNTPAYDLDTLLFIDEGRRPLGHVYDVLGQVTSPMYVVRFNSKEEIESKGITKGLPVYSAPKTQHTQYVFLKELMKMKGSDASWKEDAEVPQEFMDFSDDEAEYTFAKQSLNEQDMHQNKRKRNSVEKHKMFESAMNLKNKVDTARHKMRDSMETVQRRCVPPTTHPSVFYYQPAMNQMRQHCATSFPTFPPPSFAVPPPSFGYVNIPPPMLGMPPFGPQFGPGIPPFPAVPPQPFPPGTFGPPAIPPLPAMPPHVLPQRPPFSGTMNLLPPNMSVPKPQPNIPKSPKMKTLQNGGVVPKAQVSHVGGHKPRNSGIPKMYIPPPASVDHYQQPYPPNLGLPKSTLPPPFPGNPPPSVSIPPPFAPPMPPWPYTIPRPPHNVRGYQPHHGGGKQFKKQ